MATAPGLDTDAGTVDELLRVRPASALCGLVAGYSAYRQRGVAPMVHRGLPSPYLTVIFTFAVPLRVASHPDPRQPAGSYRSLVGGLHTAPALITHDGEQAGMQVALSPLGARAVLGVPAGALAGIDVPASELLGSTAEQVCDRLEEATSWAERVRTLDAFLTARLRREAALPAPEVRRAWHLVVASGGALGVAELAREVGWSTRHLENQLRAETGLTPKAALRVTRFHRARRRLRPWTTLAQTAAETGYYDQAHLARDFRDLAGCTASEWLASEFANVQAVVGGPAGDWRHDR